MNAQEILEQMLDRDWREADLRLAAKLLRELESSPEALAAARQNDRLRELLDHGLPKATPTQGWSKFETNLQSRMPAPITMEPGNLEQSSQPPHGSPRFRARGLWGSNSIWKGVAAAACVLSIVMAVWSLSRPRGERSIQAINPEPATPVAAKTFAGMTPGEMEQQVGLFDNIAGMFDDRAKWVAVSDGAAQMGLAQNAMPPKGRLILLRIAVLKGGMLLSRSDLAIVPGQDADMTLPFEGDRKIHYHFSATSGLPTRLAMWADLQKPGEDGVTLAALATELSTKPGDLIKAGELNTSSGDYQFQLGVFEATQKAGSR